MRQNTIKDYFEEVSIKNLTKIICKIIGYKGDIIFDSKKSGGVKRKVLDNSKLKKLKWINSISL
tara:strand:+ start:76 stop:267 length:192 start_codon:yes stop_codon:yes gene_type:complete